jgi:hypothetical protein
MNLEALKTRLMAVARATAPDDHVPYMFEKRIMARLAGVAPLDMVSLWGRALWRGAVACVGVALLMGMWSVWQGNIASQGGEFSRELETAALMPSDQGPDSW